MTTTKTGPADTYSVTGAGLADQNGKAEEFAAKLAAIEAHAKQRTPEAERAWAKLEAIRTLEAEGVDPPARGVRCELVPASAITPLAVDWHWRDYMPRGQITNIVGTEGLGKSALTLAVVAATTRGTLEGDFKGRPAKVAIVSEEDDPQHVTVPRLHAAGADLDLVMFVKLSKDGIEKGLVLPYDVNVLGATLAEAGVKLALFDPVISCLDPTLNSYKDSDVRRAMEPLARMAARQDLAVLTVQHTNGGNSSNPRQRAMGSKAWQSVPRANLLFGYDPEDDEGKHGSGRALALYKGNLGKHPPTLKVKLDSAPVKVANREKPESIVKATIGDPCDLTADDLLAVETDVSREKIGGKERDARVFLRGYLADGPKAATAILSEGDDRGLSERTLERVKKELEIRSERLPGTKVWVWRLPDDATSGLSVG